MTDAIKMFLSGIHSIISTLDTVLFDMYGFRVSLWSIIVVLIIVGMFANVWFKGAKG